MKYLLIALVLVSCTKSAEKSAAVVIDKSNDSIEIVDAYRFIKNNSEIKDSISVKFSKTTGINGWKMYAGADITNQTCWGNGGWNNIYTPLAEGYTQWGSSILAVKDASKFSKDIHFLVHYPNGDTLVAKPYIITKIIIR